MSTSSEPRSSATGDAKLTGAETPGKLAHDAFKLEKDTWAERHCPKWMVPYVQLARLNRPAGTRHQPMIVVQL